MREFGLLAIIALLFVVMSFASPYFLTWDNLRAMLLSFSIEGIVVVGMTILLIVGGIDLSVGSVVCLAMVIGGTLFLAGLDPWTASLIADRRLRLHRLPDGALRHPHRAAFLHRLAGLHGDRARPVPAAHARARRSRCSRCRRSSSSSARAPSAACPS